MADPKTALEYLIEEHGGVLVRQRKHKVFQFPNGVVFTMASTPEDHRSEMNALACVRNILGLNSPQRGAPGERREKKAKAKPEVSFLPPNLHDIPTGDLKAKLAEIATSVRQPISHKPGKKIIHPQYKSSTKPAPQPPVALDALKQKFERTQC